MLYVLRYIWTGEEFMDNVSKVILGYIDENVDDVLLKEFLIEILDFELTYKVLYEEQNKKGKHSYSKKYMDVIKEKCE